MYPNIWHSHICCTFTKNLVLNIFLKVSWPISCHRVPGSFTFDDTENVIMCERVKLWVSSGGNKFKLALYLQIKLPLCVSIQWNIKSTAFLMPYGNEGSRRTQSVETDASVVFLLYLASLTWGMLITDIIHDFVLTFHFYSSCLFLYLTDWLPSH